MAGLEQQNGGASARRDCASIVPLIINGEDYCSSEADRHCTLANGVVFQGADQRICQKVLKSSENAARSWSQSAPRLRRGLLMKLSKLLSERGEEICAIIEKEIHCTREWSNINLLDSIALIEENAALVTSEVLRGTIQPVEKPESYALVFNRPLGVVLGIAPWNAPLILGLRAVVAPVSAGNTAILKGSEYSPRTHYFIARLFVDAGFPPGVVNLLLHRPQDAGEVFENLITSPVVRKVNFTGSTAVGRAIASKAGANLKPVLLELGGKNCAIVLEDAHLERAAWAVVEGATLNNGQICMSTDTVLVVKSVAAKFRELLRANMELKQNRDFHVINQQSQERIKKLVMDATSKGAGVSQQVIKNFAGCAGIVPLTLVEDIDEAMGIYSTESFGPVLSLKVVENIEEAINVANHSGYGLSAAIWTKSHHQAISIGQRLEVGAVHVNGMTVHDEATLPHGGSGLSGFGRFGGSWGLREFVQTQTVILNA